MSAPKRVAIIGGGCAALSAAWELTRPELEGRFELTVFQPGWRLGGKGASGRGLHGRIEEHGLHVWLGFYENAFRLMREVYAELGRDPGACPLATVEQAFLPAPDIALADWSPGLDWHTWQVHFPEVPGEPGRELGAGMANPFGPTGSLVRAVELLGTLFRVIHSGSAITSGPGASQAQLMTEALAALQNPSAVIDELVERFAALATKLFSEASLLRASEEGSAVLVQLLERIGGLVRTLDLVRTENDVGRTNALWTFELILAALRGVLADRALVHPEGFDSLNDEDFRGWLLRHGASPEAVSCSFIRGLYSLMFAYEGGDEDRPACAAGACLRGVLRMFASYRGHIFYKMAAGMGDVVFAPLYEALVRRGVRFEFFHRLENVAMGGWDAEPYVEALELTVQARARANYRPLVDIRGVPSWPAEPDWSQLEDGAALRAAGARFEHADDSTTAAKRRLEVGRDFDFVVLGVGLGAVPRVAREIVARDPRWANMVRGVETVATCALQLWMRPSLEALGWPGGSMTMTSFVSPFDTWSDMTHLLPQEAFPKGEEPRSLAYFCNVLSDARVRTFLETHPGSTPDDLVARDSVEFLESGMVKYWPGAQGPEGFRWELLHPTGTSTPHPLDAQYLRANLEPTDRYTLCLPGTPSLRISPLDDRYLNLTVCGDWTSNGLDLGCVEAAVMSGQLASHALSRYPALGSIIGYDHP